MERSVPPDDPLFAHFHGRRRWTRDPCERPIRLEGADGAFDGLALDVSPGGILAAVEDPSFYEGSDAGFVRVLQVFPSGVVIRFLAEEVAVPARIVRILPHGEDRIALGCQLENTLSDVEAVLLGVSVMQKNGHEGAEEILPRESRAPASISLLLFGGSGEMLGPRFVGQVQAVGRYALDAKLDLANGKVRSLAEELAGVELLAVLAMGRRRLWTGGVTLAKCQTAPGNGSVCMRFLTAMPLGRRVQRHFRAAEQVA